MIIEDKRSKPKKTSIEGVDIPVGMVFYGDVQPAGSSTRLFLRHFGGIVDLSDPRRTWGFANQNPAWSPVIYYYAPVRASVVVHDGPAEIAG